MKKFLLVFILFSGITETSSNRIFAQLTTPAIGGNKKASVSEYIGLTKVTINYDRPGVKKREGKIWGQLIPVGFVNLGFGSAKLSPWRAGANENTTFECSTDIMIEGQTLPAGRYGFFVAYDPAECTLIFSRNSTSWGSYFYDPSEDALRVKVKPIAADRSVEWLKYEFANETNSSANVELQWEKLVIPFKVEVDLNKTQLESFRRELRNKAGFQYQSWLQAAQFAEANKTNLPEALLWTDTALNFGGKKVFQVYLTRSRLLADLGRSSEADAVMKEGLPMADENEMHQYARELLSEKKNQQAYEVFKMNYEKHPADFTTNLGMARGYSATGDYTKALVYAKKALVIAPDASSKASVETSIKNLEAGKDIN